MPIPKPVDDEEVGTGAGIVTSTVVEFSKEKIACSVGEYAKQTFEESRKAIARGE